MHEGITCQYALSGDNFLLTLLLRRNISYLLIIFFRVVEMLVTKFLIRNVLILIYCVNLCPATAMDDPCFVPLAARKIDKQLPSPDQIEKAKATYQDYKKFSDEYCAHFIYERKFSELSAIPCYQFLDFKNLESPDIVNDLPKGKVLNEEEREIMKSLSTSPVPLTEIEEKRLDELHAQAIDYFLGERRDHKAEDNLIPSILTLRMKLSKCPSYDPQQIYNEILFKQLGLTAENPSLVILDSNFLDSPNRLASHGFKTSRCATFFAKNLKVIPIRWKEYVTIEDALKKSDEFDHEIAKHANLEDDVITIPHLSREEWEQVDKVVDFYCTQKKETCDIIKTNVHTLNFMKNLVDTLMAPENSGAHVTSISIDPELLLKNDPAYLTRFSHLLEEKDILLIFSAGNETRPLSDEFQRFFATYPGLGERILFVGSHDKVGDISYFSNKPGKFSEMFIYAQGEHDDGIWGTSFAAPVVAGFIASLKENFPAIKMKYIKKIVLETTDPFPEYIGGFNCIQQAGKEFTNSFHARKEIVGKGKLNPFNAFIRCYETLGFGCLQDLQ